MYRPVIGDLSDELYDLFAGPPLPRSFTPTLRPPTIERKPGGAQEPRRTNSEAFADALTQASLRGDRDEAARLNAILQESLRVENDPAPNSASASAQYAYALLHNAPDAYVDMLESKVDLAHLREAGVLDVPTLQRMQQAARARKADRTVLLLQTLIDETIAHDQAAAEAARQSQFLADMAAVRAAEVAKPLFVRWRNAAMFAARPPDTGALIARGIARGLTPAQAAAEMGLELPRYIKEVNDQAEALRIAYLTDTSPKEHWQNADTAAKERAGTGVPATDPELIFLQKLAVEAKAQYDASVARSKAIAEENLQKRTADKAVKLAAAQATAAQVKTQALADLASASNMILPRTPPAADTAPTAKKSILGDLVTFAVLTSPAWAALLWLRSGSK